MKKASLISMIAGFVLIAVAVGIAVFCIIGSTPRHYSYRGAYGYICYATENPALDKTSTLTLVISAGMLLISGVLLLILSAITCPCCCEEEKEGKCKCKEDKASNGKAPGIAAAETVSEPVEEPVADSASEASVQENAEPEA